MRRILDVGVGDGVDYPIRPRAPYDPRAEIILCDRKPRPEEGIVYCDVEEGVLPPGRFDEIYLSHVLEHLGDPYRALRNLWGALKCGGRLHVYVPSRLHPNARADPTHRHFFTSLGLYRLLKRAGFRVLYTRASFTGGVFGRILVFAAMLLDNFFDEIRFVGVRDCEGV